MVSCVPALVLHLLQLLVSNIDSEFFVVPCEWYGVDIATLRSASDPFPIVRIRHCVDCMLLVLVVGCWPSSSLSDVPSSEVSTVLLTVVDVEVSSMLLLRRP